ncbi:MAG TPA: family 2 glycosyl transferase [Anaerolineaceae bacterium]|nr:family 2 glycosyl transferase [Anaerolineaceae bacterium]
MSQPVCSIVIRAYNEEKHIARLLTGILEQTVKDVQIILVDSGSQDDTVAIASRFPVDIVHIQPQDFTFGKSLNLGIAAAKAERVILASAHVYPVYPDWLEKLLEPFADPQIGLSYGKQRGGETSKYSENQVFRSWFPDQSTPRQTHPFCNNANAAIRRNLWQQHPYDELLTGLEDLAWARWLLTQGQLLAYAAEAEIIHVHNETWRGIYNRYRRESMAFKQIYPHETFHFTDFIRLWVSNVWNDWRAASGEHVLGKEWTNIVRFRAMQFWGTYQGYRRSGPLTWKLKQTFYYPAASLENSGTKPRNIEPIRYHEGHD